MRIGDLEIANDRPVVLIAGPCVIESREHAMETAEYLYRLTSRLGMGFIYKSSFDKANRTSGSSFRGIGQREGLAVLSEVRSMFGCSTLTDVHEPDQCAAVATCVDVMQIPAMLCRQTDLLYAAGLQSKASGTTILVKKGQFMAPQDMCHVVEKLRHGYGGTEVDVLLCERGTTFGYNDLVVDMRSLVRMKETGCPVVFDATHSVQRPGSRWNTSGGNPELAAPLAYAATAVGIAALFLETHEDPSRAPSDGATMLELAALPQILERVLAIDRVVKGYTVA